VRPRKPRRRPNRPNFELGRKLLGRYDTVKLSKPVAQLLVQLVLADDAADLAARGLGLTNEHWQVVEERPRKRAAARRSAGPRARAKPRSCSTAGSSGHAHPSRSSADSSQALIAANAC
jgi:hypothetical protein